MEKCDSERFADESLKNYEAFIRDAHKKKENKTLLNADVDQSYLGIKSLLDAAQKGDIARIVLLGFHSDPWVRLVPAIESFLSRGGKIRVLLMEEKASEILQKLQSLYDGSVEAYCSPITNVRQITHIPQIVTVGRQGYRLQLFCKTDNEKLVGMDGIINFGDEKTSNSLNNLFDAMVAKAKECERWEKANCFNPH